MVAELLLLYVCLNAFSSAGRQFDKQGNLKQWWNNRTIAEFRQAAQCIVDQYSNYTLKEINLYIDGRLTQGENIADNGGLKQAFRVIHLLLPAFKGL
jgi:membrane metallo-endopeptidase-like protein 1